MKIIKFFLLCIAISSNLNLSAMNLTKDGKDAFYTLGALTTIASTCNLIRQIYYEDYSSKSNLTTLFGFTTGLGIIGYLYFFTKPKLNPKQSKQKPNIFSDIVRNGYPKMKFPGYGLQQTSQNGKGFTFHSKNACISSCCDSVRCLVVINSDISRNEYTYNLTGFPGHYVWDSTNEELIYNQTGQVVNRIQ